MDDEQVVETNDHTIIGIGSSAGGLEAIRELVGTLPGDMPVSYVVVQHMSPHHKSLMTELVGRETKLVVKDVTDGVRPESNVIYITPPNRDILYQDGRLRLVEPSLDIGSPKPSVDRFLLSLADGHGENCVAIILSGTGSDGAYGVQAIREAGGITIAQDSNGAKYDGMPNAAVQTGCVDLILRPGEIGTHLHKILSTPRDFDSLRRGELDNSPLSDLLQILLARTRVDFREYKQTTVNRRIERRMLALGIDSREEYAQFCRNNPHAVEALFKDLLISVTRFFRDLDEFEELNRFIPNLVKNAEDTTIRVWIAGCATGEEAYSIAMLLSEALGGPQVQLKKYVQIFATDIDEEALNVARRGYYGIAALNDIPEDLSEKYLLREQDGVRVIDNLRSAVLFSDHNVCQDPPFQKIDLLCCRNVLIYFGNSLQQKVMGRFHYAMSERSIMFLGTAESIAGSEGLFVQDSQSAHIYRRRTIQPEISVLSRPTRFAVTKRPFPPTDGGAANTMSADRRMFDALMQSLGKESVLVMDDFSIIRINGNISPFTKITEKSGLRMHLDLLRSPLREEARSLTTLALKHGEPRQGVRHLLAQSDENEVRLDVFPIVAKEINERAALIVFTELEKTKDGNSTRFADVSDSQEADRIQHLENEIAATREALQQTIEELETSNEELQSLNEEMQSTNEELQATNEELETSNEELQSTNEELITVNEELQVTTAELTGRTSELSSILENAPMPIIVMDNALQITQASSTAADLFLLNRPLSTPHLSQCTLPPGYPPLAPICNETLHLGQRMEHEFASGDSQMKINSSPFFDQRGQVQGVTMVVSEFPGLAKEMELILDKSNFFIMHRTDAGDILRISNQAAAAFGLSRKDAKGKNCFDLMDEPAATETKEQDQRLLAGEDVIREDTRKIDVKSRPGGIWLANNRIVYREHEGDTPTIYSVGVDVTDVIKARQDAESAAERLALIQQLTQIGNWTVDLVNDTLEWSDDVYRIHGVTPDGYKPNLKTAIEFYHPDERDTVRERIDKASRDGGHFTFQNRIVRPDGNIVHVETLGIARKNDEGDVHQIIGAFRQIGETEGAL